MGYGCREGDAANDTKKEQVVEDYKQQDYFWPIQFPLTRSLKLKIGYCFGSEWPEILWLDVPRAVGPFQDRVELRYISFIEARVIPVGEILLGVLAFFLEVGCPSSLQQVSLDGSPLQTLKILMLHIKSVLTWSFYGHDSLKLISSILKKRLTQINGHALRKIAKEYEIFLE
ncbi:hypothetical protein VPH35_029197 [Triticum aestivum]